MRVRYLLGSTFLLVLPSFGSFAGGSASGASGVQILTSGEVLSCQARDGRDGRLWPCKIQITSHDASTGAIAGELTWPTLSSVHRIQGKLSGNSLTFTETQAIRKGSAHLNVAYTMTVSPGAATGSYLDHGDNSRGGMTITLR